MALGCTSGSAVTFAQVEKHRARFEKYVYKATDRDGCWPWIGGRRGANGYGCFVIWPRRIPAHRVALALSGVDVPAATLVLHSCDMKTCVNPRHLRIGDPLENRHDCVSRGRAKTRPLRGSASPMAKVTEDQVREIRKRRTNGESVTVLSRAYGISQAATSLIVGRKTWAHVGD